MKKSKVINKVFEIIFLICALLAVISVIAIAGFIFAQGFPAIFKIGFVNFIFGQKWSPGKNLFGIYPMIVGSISATFFSTVIGVPIGVFTGVFIAEYANIKVQNIINPAVELLAGIPSVVYGFFGLIVIVPFINSIFGGRGEGSSLLAAVVILVIMVLPTIITTTKTALLAVPIEFKEGSYALGASKEHTIIKVLLPAAKSGVFAGIILGIGRAIGETMAIILVAGNAPIVPNFFKNFGGAMTDPVRTLTANIAMEMGYASGLHQQALFATGVVLFVFIIILNLVLNFAKERQGA